MNKGMTTGASRRAFACRDHNGIAQIVAARICNLPIKAGAIRSAQRKKYKLSARSCPGGCPTGSVDAPGGRRRDARASSRGARRFRDALPCGARSWLRHGDLRSVDPHIHRGLIHLHQVSHLHPDPDRTSRLLENAGLLRFQGACRVDRADAPPGLLVFLEERPQPTIRYGTQNGDRILGDRMLVPLYCRPCPQQCPGVRVMSTTTSTTRATPTPSSLASSTKFKTFAITFAIVGPVIYMVGLFFNWPLFTFHPATNRIALGWEAARSGEGPNMTWYGWTATTLLAGSVVSFLATLLPETVTRKIPLILVWLIPFLAIPYLAWDLRQWWFHP